MRNTVAKEHGRGYVNVAPGQPCFLVSNIYCDWFCLGREGETEFFLKGDVVDGRFRFDGLLFEPSAYAPGVPLVDFPAGPAPVGWQVEMAAGKRRVKLVGAGSGDMLFAYRLLGTTCLVATDLYNETGTRVAMVRGDDFVVLKGPAELGRGGIVIG